MRELNNTNIPQDVNEDLPSEAPNQFINTSKAMIPSTENVQIQKKSFLNCECGNGFRGHGVPGERQVNNTNEDINRKPHATQSETSLARFGSYILFGFNDSNDPNNFSGFAFSSDSGITWTDGGTLPQNPQWINGGDPVISSDSNGIFYYSTLGLSPISDAGIILLSTGQVDPQTRKITLNTPFVAGVGSNAANFEDKEWMVVGPDLRRGDKPEAVYITWTDFSATNSTIRFSKWSTGLTPSVLIPSKLASTETGVQGSFPVIDTYGNIYVFYEKFENNIDRKIRMVKSTNGGIDFSNPIPVADVKVAANNDSDLNCGRPAIQVAPTKSIRSNEIPHAAIAPDGTLYVVYASGIGNTIPQPEINIYLAYSTDHGENWTNQQITSNTTYAFFPSVIVNSQGAHIQYSRFDGANGVGNGRFALFMKHFSITNGLSAEEMVSTVFSLVPDTNPNFDNYINKCYMGDYNQIIRGPGLSLYHGWGDNRNDIYNGNNPDVFFIQTGEDTL